jgi:RNA polymerase sigma-54 factor
MDMKPRLHMKMQQQLVMTPRLQMALKILQVSTLELEQFLKQELLQNPLLDRVEEEESELDKSDGEQEAREERDEQGGHEEEREERQAEEVAERDAEKDQADAVAESQKEDLDWDDYLDDVYAHAYGQNFARDDDDERYERVPVAVATFEDELKHQLHMECTDESLIGVAEYIIDELDSDGYVNDPFSEIARALRTDVDHVGRASRTRWPPRSYRRASRTSSHASTTRSGEGCPCRQRSSGRR